MSDQGWEAITRRLDKLALHILGDARKGPERKGLARHYAVGAVKAHLREPAPVPDSIEFSVIARKMVATILHDLNKGII